MDNFKAKSIALVGSITLAGLTTLAFHLAPEPWNENPRDASTAIVELVPEQSPTPTEPSSDMGVQHPTNMYSGSPVSYDEATALLDTCDYDYVQGSDVWESCVSVILTATCMFEPLPEDHPDYATTDERCLWG